MTLILKRKLGEGVYIIDKETDPDLPISRISLNSVRKTTVTVYINQKPVVISKGQGKAFIDSNGNVVERGTAPVELSVMRAHPMGPSRFERGRPSGKHARLCFDATMRYKILREEFLTPGQIKRYEEARK